MGQKVLQSIASRLSLHAPQRDGAEHPELAVNVFMEMLYRKIHYSQLNGCFC
ncbi:hypothetical protein [Methylomonas sp. AM2-LC]|uniref:hypothetical protein n=1 Tax=Methylomonas sp. AM2-LC TaxID=3153301 RepID=UPI0032651C28